MKKNQKKKRLRFIPRDKRGIPIAELIATHRQFEAESSVPENIGDGFLLSTNPIFRSIRREFLRLGFSFSLHDPCHYYSFPLMSLDDVIAAKTVPYRNNFVWLESLEKAAPKFFTLTELKRSELQFNYLFHESAHFIAHQLFFGRRAHQELPKTSNTLLQILSGEAFANTVECLASIFVEGEIGSYFLDANCYFRSNEKEIATLLKFEKKIGYQALTKILFAAFLYSNFLYERLEEKELRLIAKLAGIDLSLNFKALVQVGLTLSQQFRSTTTQLHLMKIGFQGDLNQRMNFDPLSRLLEPNNVSVRKIVDQLVGIACQELGS